MKLFTRALKGEQPVTKEIYTDSTFIAALLDNVVVTRETVMSIPILKRSINFIADTISTLDWHLYENVDGNIADKCDYRCDLLNKSSNSNIKSSDIIKNMVIDYLVYGSAYCNMKRRLNTIEKLTYIDPTYVSTTDLSVDHLNPQCKLYVDGKEADVYDYIILTYGGTLDGLQGLGGIVNTDRELVELAFLATRAMKSVTNGNKFIASSENKLSKDSLDKFRADIKGLFDSNSGILVVNKGVEVEELGRSSVDNQFVQMYQEINKQLSYILGIPMTVLDGTCSDEVYNQTIKGTVLPVISVLEKAVTDSMLLEVEKPTMEFKINTNGLLRTSMKERYECYSLAIKAGFLSRNDVRRMENQDIVEGLDTFVLSLGEVLFDPKTGEYKNFNKDTVSNFKKGGEKYGD